MVHKQRKINDDILLEHVGLPHVLPLTVHQSVEGTIMNLSDSLSFFVGPFLHT